MRKIIFHFLINLTFLVNSLMASASALWEGSTADITERLRSHNTYISFEDLQNGFLPILNAELHEDFKTGFGAMFLAHEEGCARSRLPAIKENGHIACLYEALVKAPDLDMQKINLYCRLDIGAHYKYFTAEFLEKIQS